MICGPKKKQTDVLIINNGPKAIVIFDLNLPNSSNINEIKQPITEARKSIKIASSGPPINNPNAKHSLTSPPPIHLPFDI
jgi:hypothetical protein